MYEDTKSNLILGYVTLKHVLPADRVEKTCPLQEPQVSELLHLAVSLSARQDLREAETQRHSTVVSWIITLSRSQASYQQFLNRSELPPFLHKYYLKCNTAWY